MNTIEKQILRNLIHNEIFMRKAIPFLKVEYFTDVEKEVFRNIQSLIDQYNVCPTIDALEIQCNNDAQISEERFSEVLEYITDISSPKKVNEEWLLNETEKFCQEKAVYNAILKSISIMEGAEKKLSKDGIPSLLQDALAVSFDTNIGLDWGKSAEERYDAYNEKTEKIPFDLEIFNKITSGGLERKTLSVILAPTGVGKSLSMCHMAAAWLKLGYNVLYISMEMSEKKIAARIDANLLDVNIKKIGDLPKQTFTSRVSKIQEKARGKLVIKEYPTSQAHANHFRALLNDLNLKQDFTPDIVIVDYINICASSRYKPSANNNSYMIVKAIAEELRGLAVEYNVAMVSATQANRSGFDNSDIDITNTSESMGLPHTVDLFLAMISTEELEELGQIMFKQLKNRDGDLSFYRRFVVGIDRGKMRLYDLEDTAQNGISKEDSTEIKSTFKHKKLESGEEINIITMNDLREGLKGLKF